MKHLRCANFDERPPASAIDMLVFHYTGMQSCQDAMDRLCDPLARVSAHYVIDEHGGLFQLVDEDCRAWHAGVACWRGDSDINDRSIGIELANPGHKFGLKAFPEAQMQTLEGLSSEIIGRHEIPARNVVGHSDVAPRRKEDPGELFDWFRLSKGGIGLWPLEAMDIEIDPQQATAMLADYGYETVDLSKTVQAFQRHYRPATIDGVLDQQTAALLDRLRAAVG